MERFIAFDVETPNSRNDRMSAIGLAVIENGRIRATYNTIINPETYFDYFNIGLTGITPELASQAPTFDEVWKDIGSVMENSILIAHNAPFDMSVLAKCLRAYHIDTDRFFNYACTVRLARKLYPSLPNHRLDTLCSYLGIPLDHHRADSDSIACAKLAIEFANNGLVISDNIRTYDLVMCKTLPGAARRTR